MHTELAIAIIVVVALILLTWWSISMDSGSTDSGAKSTSPTRSAFDSDAIQSKATAFHKHERYWSDWLYGIRVYIIGKSSGYAGIAEEADRLELLIKRIGMCLSRILGKPTIESEFLDLLLDYHQKLLRCIDMICLQSSYDTELSELNEVCGKIAVYIEVNSNGKVSAMDQLNAWKARSGSVFNLAETLVKGNYSEGNRTLDVAAEGNMISHKHLVKAFW